MDCSELTHPNLKVYPISSTVDGGDILLMGGPAFINFRYIPKQNYTSDVFWDDFILQPQHIDRVYYLKFFFNDAKKYIFRFIGRIQVNDKMTYIDITFTRVHRLTYLCGKVTYISRHFLFINSLSLCLNCTEEIHSYLKRDGVEIEMDRFFVQKPEMWRNVPKLTHLCNKFLFHHKSPLAMTSVKYLKDISNTLPPLLGKCLEDFFTIETIRYRQVPAKEINFNSPYQFKSPIERRFCSCYDCFIQSINPMYHVLSRLIYNMYY